MESRIAVLLPTRGKPAELLRVYTEIRETSSNADLYAYVATDDPKYDQYKLLADWINIEFGPSLGFVGAINKLAEKCTQYDLLMVASDDFGYIANGWDEIYLNSIPMDGLAMIYVDAAPFDGRDLPFTGAVTQSWYKHLGYVLLPALKHMYSDNAMQDLARLTKCEIRIANPEIIQHYWNMGDPIKAVNYYPPHDPDFNAYNHWRDAGGLVDDACKLRAG